MRPRSLAAVALLALSALSLPSYAATTFEASTTSANGELSTSLTWSSDRAQCVASGHESWSGPQPSSGTLQLPTITLSGTYTLTLTCSTPASLSAKLTWTNPTTNTDGTAYTNGAGTRIYYGRSESVLDQTTQTNSPTATTLTLEGLAPGPWFFGAKAYNTAGAEGAISNLVTKITQNGGSDPAESVTLTVNPIPGAPTNLTVE